MTAKLLDADSILSDNEQWMKLEEEWGKPVDLETEEDCSSSIIKPVFSTLDLRKSTFNSSFLFKKVRRKIGRQLSKTSALDYKDFIQDLEKVGGKEAPIKQFYYINGQILSAQSVEDICDRIDEMFKSVEKLCSATSTIRDKKKNIPDVVNCSISTDDLSFDDTLESHKVNSDGDDVDRYIDEAFDQFNYTMATLSTADDADNEATRESVTTLVKRFSSILSSPAVNCSPRRKKQCCNRFKELADFWKNRAFDNSF